MLVLVYIISAVCVAQGTVFYDSFRGVPITKEEVKVHDKVNNTFWCVTEIEPCNPDEERRVDGSCNNLRHPSRGTSHTPFTRVLPPIYSKDFSPKLTASGNEMPLARKLRTHLIAEGNVPSQTYTTLAIHFFVFMSADVVSLHDTVNYILWKPYCCLPRGKTDSMCAPNEVPIDDPVHRFSGIRCLNQTKPETFQTVGCIKNGTAPERIVSSTPLLDLSVVYGNLQANLERKGRLNQGGLLKYDVDDAGRIWPPSTKTNATICLLNQLPRENRCHDTPEDGSNTLGSINIVFIWFWRNHNFIATNLAQVNPCWDDDKLFRTARDINIAISLELYYYELLPVFLGNYNLISDGVINPSGGFRDLYNENVLPQLSLEYPFVLRWVHTIQDGPLKLYDTDGYYLRQVPIVNLTLRTGFFGVDNNMDYVTHGSFRQGSGNVDYIAHPDITELGLGPHQHVSDLMTSDMNKNRLFGFQPYVVYVKFCTGRTIKSFDQLRYRIDPERIELLKEVYETVEDIDLIAGIWVEKPIRGGSVPPTFYCLVVDQLKRNIVSDRHWYERPNRPHAFTYEQLSQVKRISMARFLCDVGDKMTKIQPYSFLRAGPGNEMIDCDQIAGINYNAWRDDSCYSKS